MGWSNFLAHPPTPGGYLTRRPSEVNSDGANPTQECTRKKTRCAFVRSLSDVISLVLCFSFLGLFLYRDGSDIVYRYRGDSLTFCIYTRMRCP